MIDFIPKAQVIENFLSDDDINQIEKKFREFSDLNIQIEHHTIKMGEENPNELAKCRAHYWYPGESIFMWMYDFCNAKVREKYGSQIDCGNWHILNAFKPYQIHSDSYDEDNHDNTLPTTQSDGTTQEYAWTFLVPLEDYDAHTLVFNQTSTFTKDPLKWIQQTNAPILNSIDDETYEKYLTHTDKNTVKHFSIDTKFPWKKGNLLAMSRHSFHSSCNFPADGVIEKRALIGWSCTKDMEQTIAYSKRK